MEMVSDDVVDLACEIASRFSEQFIAAWASNDGMRVGILVREVAATAIYEERQRAGKAGQQEG